MPSSLRRLGIFLVCLLSFTALARVAVAAWINLFGAFGVIADHASQLSVSAAAIAAYWLTKRINDLYARRVALRALEQGWEKWSSEIAAQKSVSVAKSISAAKKVA